MLFNCNDKFCYVFTKKQMGFLFAHSFCLCKLTGGAGIHFWDFWDLFFKNRHLLFLHYRFYLKQRSLIYCFMFRSPVQGASPNIASNMFYLDELLERTSLLLAVYSNKLPFSV